jgi:hypothetical protein
MNEAPVSCIPATGKMSKTKKIIDEARDLLNPELDLADKALTNFEEMPGLRESSFYPYTCLSVSLLASPD